MVEFAVFAKVKNDPATLTLRRGFSSRDAAEDHPVQMKLWERVWVDEIGVKVPAPYTLPPFPWSVIWEGRHSYVVDADGRKIATIFGTQKRQELIAEFLCAATADRARQAVA